MKRYLVIAGTVVTLLTATGCADSTGTAATVASTPTTTAAMHASTATTGPGATGTTIVTTSTTTTTAAAATTTVPARPWDLWTLIYASLDASTNDRRDAETIAATIEGGTVLSSDDYPSLNPGYWVVYAGEWGSRSEAGIWCPKQLDPELTCYPRYLGDDIAQMLEQGAALAQVGGRLVALDVETGAVLATFSDTFHNEAEFPSSFNLTADAGQLFFGLGWEDSWYSCDSDRGEIRWLDLDTGVEETFADGWAPDISPDGRWLAIVAASRCYPDPEVGGWVVTPGSQVEIYDLADGDSTPDYILRPATPPTSYDDPQGVFRVFWDPARSGGLLVSLVDESVRRLRYDATMALDSAPIEYQSQGDNLAAVTGDSVYFVEYADEGATVERVARGRRGRHATDRRAGDRGRCEP